MTDILDDDQQVIGRSQRHGRSYREDRTPHDTEQATPGGVRRSRLESVPAFAQAGSMGAEVPVHIDNLFVLKELDYGWKS
jgi:hypothetical protein